jgi:hypothetical protein
MSDKIDMTNWTMRDLRNYFAEHPEKWWIETLDGCNLSEVKQDKDVTKLVKYTWNEGESLAIIKCVCGKEFEQWGEFSIGIEREYADECPNCHRKLYWKSQTQIYEVVK